MSKAQNVAGVVATLAATTVTKKVLDRVWRLGSGGQTPPDDPTNPREEVREQVVWAILSGAAVSVVRLMLSRRLARGERHEKREAAQVFPNARRAGDSSAGVSR